MRIELALLLAFSLTACVPTLNNDDDDAAGDDDDATGDDDDVTDDDDATGDDDDITGDDDDTPPPPSDGIRFGYSFGECMGECTGSLFIPGSGFGVTFQTSDWDGAVYVDRYGDLWDGRGEELAAISARVDLAALEPVYGCPDCADGGARTIEWDLGPVARTTTYEWGNPPDILAELNEVLVVIEAEIASCQFGGWFSWIEGCDIPVGTDPGAP